MESKYVIAGLTINTIATVFAIYGVLTSSYSVIGSALSAIVLGVVITVIGVTHVEPVEELLRHYVSDIDLFSTRILEDMGIMSEHRVKTCSEKKLLVFFEKNISCDNVSSGIGVLNNTPYIAIPIVHVMEYVSNNTEELRNLIDKLKLIFVDISSICKGVSVNWENDTLVVELVKVLDRGQNYVNTPVNLVRLYVLAIISSHFKKDAEILEEIRTQDGYRIRIKTGD